jgi:hypothetical protein
MPLVSYPSALSNPRALLVPRFDTDVGLLEDDDGGSIYDFYAT